MKKATSGGKKSNATSSSASGTCLYLCVDGDFQLVQDNSQPGYYCENYFGTCEDGETIEVDAWPDGSDDGGGTDDGGGIDNGGGIDGGQASARKAKSRSLPKNTAIYRYVRSRKVVRRERGAWAKGFSTPLEMTLKELAKYAPKVYKIVSLMAKNGAVASFEVLIPAQKNRSKNKKAAVKSASKSPAKKSKSSGKRTSSSKRKP